jgi:hypothetical protein
MNAIASGLPLTEIDMSSPLSEKDCQLLKSFIPCTMASNVIRTDPWNPETEFHLRLPHDDWHRAYTNSWKIDPCGTRVEMHEQVYERHQIELLHEQTEGQDAGRYAMITPNEIYRALSPWLRACLLESRLYYSAPLREIDHEEIEDEYSSVMDRVIGALYKRRKRYIDTIRHNYFGNYEVIRADVWVRYGTARRVILLMICGSYRPKLPLSYIPEDCFSLLLSFLSKM